MATPWPTKSPQDYLSGAYARTMGRDIFDRQQVIKSQGWTIGFGSNSGVTNSYVTVLTFYVRIPNFCRGGELLRISADLSHGTIGNTAYMRIADSGGTNGTDATVMGTTPTLVSSDITVPDDTWAGTVRTFYVQLKNGGAGTAYCSANALIGNMRVIA